jgi:4-hydroxy-tetrahydrodipicolinate synthase
MIKLSGTITALVTPIKPDGALDLAAFSGLVEDQLAAGVEGVAPAGTTGESATLSHEEHHDVIKRCVEVVRGRAMVLAGCGSNNTRESLSLIEYAEKVGADAALLVSPYYNRPSQEGIYLHYKAVAEHTRLPVVMYSVPSRTGREIAIETVARLSEIKNIVAIKEAGGSVDRVSAIKNACGVTVISGDDSLTVPMIAVGAAGVISVASNAIPGEIKEMVDAALAGDYEAARKVHYRYYDFMNALFLENNPAGIKAAMKLQGRCNGALRLPLTPITSANVEKLREVMEGCGVLKKGKGKR